MNGQKISEAVNYAAPQPREEQTGLKSRRVTGVFGVSEQMETGRTINIFILDRSGSTAEPIGKGNSASKISGIRDAVITFVLKIQELARVGLIGFASVATVDAELVEVKGNKLSLIRAIQQMRPGGSTAMEEALLLAIEQVKNIENGFFKRAYLLTDGLPNPGSDPSSAADELKSLGVQLHVTGYGQNSQIDEELLTRMASSSANGKKLYYHFEEAKKLTELFKRESHTITV